MSKCRGGRFLKKHSRMDIFVLGFALFSMFFGAGNVIFPPYLGMAAGPKWIMAFVCYYVADIGLAMLALFSISRQGSANSVLAPIGRIPATIMMCAIVMCIGPMLGIPRTAAMTFEMSIQPNFPQLGSMLFSLLFFGVVFLCAVRENSVIDIVGKILTPLLLVGLLVLIGKGIFTPLGTIAAQPQLPNVGAEGIKAGYQTMDVLATMLFGGLMLRSAESKGYTAHNEKHKVTVKASLVAGVLLLAVYSGLNYLGSTVSNLYDTSISRSALLLNIMSGLLGQRGTALFAVVVGLACLTTAVGLVSSCSDYFSGLTKGKVPYPIFVGAICLFSAVASNVGLEQLVSIAAPILDVVYPPALVIIVMSFLPGTHDWAIRFAVSGALLFSVLMAVSTYGIIKIPFLDQLPMASIGFGWVIPAVLFGLVGAIASRFSQANAKGRGVNY